MNRPLEVSPGPSLAEVIAERDALRAEVEAQRALTQTLNHRIKNSLQLVSSLFRLQGRRLEDPELRHQFDEASSRISTIALIHQQLYRDRAVETLDFSRALSSLCEELSQATPDRPVHVEAADSVFVRTDQAVPLALAVGELVSNAQRHAYPEEEQGPEEQGVVAVTLTRTGNGMVEIRVADQGVGLPDSVSLQRPASFGLMLITSLTAQVGGKIALAPQERGTAFVIALSEKA